ncbi:MAG TPA: NAD(P)-dependent oxidoreductase [Bacteroidota bacterium]|nr:NAD(P)-dependent oxidoreductase [Bacteroidota bacterium]
MSNALFTEDLNAILAATSRDWGALKAKTVVLTGASGFVGRWLLESFLYANDEFGLRASCIALTRDRNRFVASLPHLAAHPALRIVEGDVRAAAFESTEQWFGVIHAAADSAGRFTDTSEVRDVIVEGTRHMITCARLHAAEKFLFLSSGAVYGALPSGVPAVEGLNGVEDSAHASVYARSKAEAERLCLDAHAMLTPVIARLFAFVGPLLPLDEHFAIGNFIGDALAGRTIRIDGDGTPVRSYLYAADMAAWLWTVFFRGDALGVYNIGSDRPVTITDIAMHTALAFGRALPVEINSADAPSARERSYYVPSVSKIRRDLGVSVWTDIDAAIKKTIAWHQAQTPVPRQAVSR